MDVIDSNISIDDEYCDMKYQQYVQLVQDKKKNKQLPKDKRYRQGFFIPKNYKKCINIIDTSEPQPIVYRSGWEKQFFEFCDSNMGVVRWGSELIKILYPNPFTKKMSFYIPDGYMEVLTPNKKIEKYLVEIKPLKETLLSETSNNYDKIFYVKNIMKWRSAIEYCNKRGIKFKILSDNDFR